jgi:hypothetical protein
MEVPFTSQLLNGLLLQSLGVRREHNRLSEEVSTDEVLKALKIAIKQLLLSNGDVNPLISHGHALRIAREGH